MARGRRCQAKPATSFPRQPAVPERDWTLPARSRFSSESRCSCLRLSAGHGEARKSPVYCGASRNVWAGKGRLSLARPGLRDSSRGHGPCLRGPSDANGKSHQRAQPGTRAEHLSWPRLARRQSSCFAPMLRPGVPQSGKSAALSERRSGSRNAPLHVCIFAAADTRPAADCARGLR